MEQVSSWKSHGGVQGVYTHASTQTATTMTFSAFVPDHVPGEKLPVLWYLSGLTCTHANVTEKGEYRTACAEHGIVFVAPDTSPRGPDVPDDPEGLWDFGQGDGAADESTASHAHVSYSDPGTYTATLTVEDGNGGVFEDEFEIVVTGVAPRVQATATPTSGRAPLVVSLGGSAEDDIALLVTRTAAVGA